MEKKLELLFYAPEFLEIRRSVIFAQDFFTTGCAQNLGVFFREMSLNEKVSVMFSLFFDAPRATAWRATTSLCMIFCVHNYVAQDLLFHTPPRVSRQSSVLILSTPTLLVILLISCRLRNAWSNRNEQGTLFLIPATSKISMVEETRARDYF